MKRKLNALPLSLRERKRYLLFSMNTVTDFEKIINTYLRSFFGTYFLAQMELKIIKSFLKKDQTLFILKTSRGEHEKVIAALELFKESEGKYLNLKLEKVSGTIKTLKDFLEK